MFVLISSEIIGKLATRRREFEKADTKEILFPFAARIVITTVIIKASYRYRRA
jgi:hypothetical protein